jgi:ABC-type phosphate/phosphonate transport system substrate-binding protein
VALSLEETNDAVGAASLDFVFSYPSHFTCLSAQHGARTIATVQRARRVPAAPATPVPLSVFGGVFFALANRSDIATLQDIAGQRLEGTDVTSLGAGQAQWAELASRGLSFWNMPSEVIFSGNQYTVIADVAAGTADVGMVRTDLLETVQLPPPYCNATAAAAIGLRCYPAGTFKILEPRLVAGYPFNSSTQLWPEWPVAALPHVDVAIQKAVTQALFEFGTAAASLPFAALGEVASFVPALDYMGVRDMLHAQGWIVNGSCLAAARVQDSIVCPPGSFKRAADAIARTCLERGLLCPADHECVCAPCQALPAQQLTVALAPAAAPGNATVCARMRICATPQQNDALLLTVTDNWADARAGLGLPPVLSVLLKFDATLTQIDDQSWLTAPPTGNGTWALRIPTPRTGFFLVEAEADGTALDASPLVVSVVPPVCAGLDAAPDVEGVCVCAKRHVAEGPRGDCVAVPAFSVTAVAAGSAAGAAALVLLIAAVVLLMHRRAEALWRISHSAVTFLDPPEVLGRGTFGLVVKGTYRGTTVALKRSLPMEPRSGSTNGTGANTGASKPVGGMASRNSSDRLSQFDLQALNEFAQGDRAPTPKAASETPRAAPRLSGSGNGAITVRVTGGGSRSGGCTRSGSRSTSATGASSVLPVFCAGACPALDGLLGALWRRRKAAALRADFIREMRLLVHLRHPHILTVLGAVLHESEPILVMEHMDRGSLHDLLHNETLPLDGDVVLQLLRDIVSGMEFLHSADPPVLHNDLKAANVLVGGRAHVQCCAALR